MGSLLGVESFRAVQRTLDKPGRLEMERSRNASGLDVKYTIFSSVSVF